MRQIGVYLITNRANGKVYVGSSACVPKRLYEHRRLLRNGTHRNVHLQAAWNLAPDTFDFDVLARFDTIEQALAHEEQMIALHRSTERERGYNVCPLPTANRLGAKLTPEQCERVGRSKRGNSFRRGAQIPDEMRERIRAKLKGRPLSAETRAKMSAVRRGVPKSPEWCAKQRAAWAAKREARASA